MLVERLIYITRKTLTPTPKMKNSELVFIPSPATGHFGSMLQIAQNLIDRDQRLSITVLVLNLPFNTGPHAPLLSSDTSSSCVIKFVNLPKIDPVSELNISKLPNPTFSAIDSQKSACRAAVHEIVAELPESTRLVGIVFDMFCINMIDIATELAVPSYVYFTSNAGFLGFLFRIQTITDELNQDVVAEYWDCKTDLFVPSFKNPVPAKVFPSHVLDKEGSLPIVLLTARRLRETKGIMINTFFELELHAIKSLEEDPKIPLVYSVGPILNPIASRAIDDGTTKNILQWLDDQPPSSVVFLCFGSLGSFRKDQVEEIAKALERTGHRFLWSLRQPPEKGKLDGPSEYSNLEALPEGFLERTKGIGKVIGWAPQIAVLSHGSVGGFVTHCGWNSILESLWYGVPMAAWPMYAEQQINAFEMVMELGLAVEIKMDYRNDEVARIVGAEDIERGIKEMMKDDERGREMRKKVKDMGDKCRMVLSENGSSYVSLGQFIEDIIQET